MKYAALLRAVNVGGTGKLPMAELVELFAAAGAKDARSYLQSGNVVFEATAAIARRIPERIETAVDKAFGHRPAVLLRDAKELAQIPRDNPFAKADPKLLHVGFLADAPSKAAIAALDPDRSPGDRFCVRGRTVYFQFKAGVGKTKLSNSWFETKLATRMTWRNWNTLQALIELTKL
ncbi:MAG: DUF1697 domain-containing protein [Acidobacteriota bacterium]